MSRIKKYTVITVDEAGSEPHIWYREALNAKAAARKVIRESPRHIAMAVYRGWLENELDG